MFRHLHIKNRYTLDEANIPIVLVDRMLECLLQNVDCEEYKLSSR